MCHTMGPCISKISKSINRCGTESTDIGSRYGITYYIVYIICIKFEIECDNLSISYHDSRDSVLVI